MLRLFPFLLVAVFVASSCSPTMNLYIPVQVPPQVILPEDISSLALANRSLPVQADGEKVVNVVEGVLTGEGFREDRAGARACLAGAQSQMEIDQLVEVKALDSLLPGGTGTGMQPLPMAWDEVEAICNANGVDALLALEVFDTDQAGSMTTNTINQIRNVAQGGTVRPPAPPTNTRVRVKVAWRLYDPKGKMILDEVRMNDFFGVGYRGTTLPDLGEFAKRDAIQQSGYAAGRAYGDRFFPSALRLRRVFYQRKGQEMRRATRLVEVNEWDEAMSIWEPLVTSAKRRTAGRACYNMAIALEVKGDIQGAIDWAKRAYSDFGENRARDYARILRNRL
jgi:hypothetical protein